MGEARYRTGRFIDVKQDGNKFKGVRRERQRAADFGCVASVMFLVHNEQTKLTAAWLNTLATALVAAGTFAPFAALFYGFGFGAGSMASSADSQAFVSPAGSPYIGEEGPF